MRTLPRERTAPAPTPRPPGIAAVAAGGALVAVIVILAAVLPTVVGARPLPVGLSGIAAGSIAVLRSGSPAEGDLVSLADGPDGAGGLGLVLAPADASGRLLTGTGSGRVTVDAERVDGVVWYVVPWVGVVWEAAVSPAGMLLVAGALLLLVAYHERHSPLRRSPRGHPPKG